MNKSNIKKTEETNKKAFKMPSSFAILISILLIIVMITWVLSWSGVSTTLNGEEVDIKALGILDVPYAILKSFSKKAGLTMFLFMMGAFVLLMDKTKSLEAGISSLIKGLKGKEIILVPLLMLLFSIGGTTFGMAEETIPFYLLLIPLFITAGFDAMTAFLVILLGAGIGTAGSIINPFKIPIAVDAMNEALNSMNGTDIVYVTMSDGMVFRFIGYIVLTAITISFVTWYAWTVKKDPSKSQVKEIEDRWSINDSAEMHELHTKRKITLGIFVGTFIFFIFCLLPWETFGVSFFINAQEWLSEKFPYIESLMAPMGLYDYIDMTMVFLIGFIIMYFVNRKELIRETNFQKLFYEGCSTMISVAGIIVIATGIQVLMEASNLQPLIINGLNNGLGGMNPTMFIAITFVLFIGISFLIPSSSGFAAAIFPIFGPTSYGVGLGSGSITAFTYSSGLVNMVSPTSGILCAVSETAKIPYNVYIRTVWPLMIGLFLVMLSILLIGSSQPVLAAGLF